MSKGTALPASRPQTTDYLQMAVWSEHDGCYVGSAPPLTGPSCDSPESPQDVAELFCKLDEIVEEYLEIFEQDGLPIPSPAEADTIGLHYLVTPGDHILRCRLLDASRSFLSDGAFQNQVGADQPCFMPLPRTVPLRSPDHLSARYLHFSETLIVPVEGLKPLSSGSFKVVGYRIAKDESSSSLGTAVSEVAHLI